jgi:general secretion pathway protein F
MTTFVYTALDNSGRRTSGNVAAETRTAAMDQVLGLGLAPVLIEEQRNGNGAAKAAAAGQSVSTKVSKAAVESFTRELSNLLEAGLPLSRALHLLRREASTPGAKNVWGKVHDDVVGGKSLAESLAKWPKAFSSVYVAMVKAGEAGGFLPVVLQQIAEFRTREQELKGKVLAAMIYPCVLAFLGICAVIFLLTFFIPRMSGIFEEFGGKLPALTQGIIAASHWLKSYGWILAIIGVGGAIATRRATTSEAGRRFLERTMLKTPLLG